MLKNAFRFIIYFLIDYKYVVIACVKKVFNDFLKTFIVFRVNIHYVESSI